jgi:ligand-binding sensor domain-containing protein
MRLLSLLLIFFNHFGLFSQNLPCINYTVNSGLPSNSIKAIFKDSRGFLWIGTEGGLACFNGKSFKIFNETNGLKCNQVWGITEDDKQNLWISLYGKGLAKYDGNKFTYFDKKDGLVNNAIRRIYFSKKNKCLILGTEDGLSIFDGKKFKNFNQHTLLNKFQIVGINERNDELFIYATHDKVYKLLISKKISNSKIKVFSTPEFAYSSYIDNNYYFFGGTDHFLHVKNLKSQFEQKYPCLLLWDFTKDNSNTIYGAGWNVTDPNGGLFAYKNNTFKDITKKASIISNGLWCLFFDKQTNQLWCGSIDHGLYKVNLSQYIQLYTKDYFNVNSFSPQEMFEDEKENIWIGAKDNIIIKHKFNKYTIFSKEKLLSLTENWCMLNSKKLEDLISKSQINGGFSCFNIISDKVNNIWVNTTWGTFCFNPKFELKFFFGSYGGHLIFDSNDITFYGHMYGNIWEIKNKYDWTKGITNHILTNRNIPRDINKVLATNNQIWYASQYNGLYVYQNKRFISLNEQGKFNESSVTDLATNNKGEIIIGTSSGNVYIATYHDNTFNILQKYEANKQIIGSSISFVEHLNGIYYIGTNTGINLIKNNKRIKFINQSEGLTDVNFIDCIKSKSGLLYISTNKGIFTIDSHKIIHKSKSHQPIYIQSISVNNKPLQKESILSKYGQIQLQNNTLELTYLENNIDIQFNCNNLFNAPKNVYRYKIIELNTHWSNYSEQGKISLLGVPSGNYTILLEGFNTGTGELFKPNSFNLIIHPPFWKTWWFIIFILVIIITLLVLIIRYRIRFIEKREREKAIISNKLTEIKLEALRAQMNPHFTFNAINSIQNFIIDNNTTQAMFYLGEFSKLIRQTLENASEKFMSLESEIQFLESYLCVQKMRFDKVYTSIKLQEGIDKYRIQIPPLILQPFIENAFEHAFQLQFNENQKIEIDFSIIENKLICFIRDNGIGFNSGDSNSFHRSFGQKLTKDRLDLLNREFQTSDFNFKIRNLKSLELSLSGTEVKITFPVIYR